VEVNRENVDEWLQKIKDGGAVGPFSHRSQADTLRRRTMGTTLGGNTPLDSRDGAAGKRNPLAAFFKVKQMGILSALVILVIVFSVSTPVFLTLDNLTNIVRQVSILGILAVGMTMVIVSGEIDLSVGSVFGMYRPEAGTVLLEGKPLSLRSPRGAIREGFAFIPEDRRRQGLFSNMDVKDNMAVIHDRKITTLSFVQARKALAIAREYVDKLSIKVTGLLQRMANLSGGNQQKVIIGRSLSTSPRILIMDEPTRGIDVGAKAEIYKILRRLRCEENKAIIMVSSELEEVVAECDRVVVMFQGRVSGELSGTEITKENVLHFAFGGSAGDATRRTGV
jgi:ABC-type uncharacterized transport system ATPase subunit